ncbi:MAG: S8 family serine peptidase [bacterium]
MKKVALGIFYLALSCILFSDSVAHIGVKSLKLPNLNTIDFQAKPANPKMHSTISRVLQAYKEGGLKGAASFWKSWNMTMKDGKIRVILEINPTTINKGIETVKSLGGTVESTCNNFVQILCPLSSLESLSSVPEINYIRQSYFFKPDTMSEGIPAVGATAWHEKGYHGQGVKVAIVDAGFQGYEELLGTELPVSVTARSFREDGDITGEEEVHGTACAEIVHDMAPQSQLYLINFATDVEFSNAIDYLISEGVHIISHSIGWFNTGPGDGTGKICRIVDKAKAAGIVWVNSAGNNATMHWEGEFIDELGDNWHEFDPSINNEGNAILTLEEFPIVVLLRWDDWPVSDQDYDLYVFDESGETIIASSTNIQNGTQAPMEEIICPAPYTGFYFIAIHKKEATRDVYFDLYTPYQDLIYGYFVTESSLSQPADSPNALAVGATYWLDDSLEYFSSQGPTDGDNPRIKPDLTAPDGVSTEAYGPADPDWWMGFFGTSASCPHVAGAAALLKSWDPTQTPDQIKSYLQSHAFDLGDPGKDNLFGYGRLDLAAGPPERPCEGNFDSDNDVDGTDLALFTADLSRTDLSLFAADFGRSDCP